MQQQKTTQKKTHCFSCRHFVVKLCTQLYIICMLKCIIIQLILYIEYYVNLTLVKPKATDREK